MTDNFLPKFKPRVTNDGRSTIPCLVRNKAVRATPEERVRQRVLHWLIEDVGWDKALIQLEQSYRWESDPARAWIRPDIELTDSKGVTLIVVECKAENIPLGEAVDRQAIEYGIKSRAKYIWTTNGENHRFLRWSGESWLPSETLDRASLSVRFKFPDINPEFPENPSDSSSVSKYFEKLVETGDNDFSDFDDKNLHAFTLAVHKLLFYTEKKLPYSHAGVHVLEDRGSTFLKFNNASGHYYQGRYRNFIAATSGRVEALSVAVNPWGSESVRLCVGVSKPDRTHHSLQLSYDDCILSESGDYWDVWHRGSMANAKIDDCHGGR